LGAPLTLANYAEFLRDLKSRIRQSQLKAAVSVNRELVLLYWQIGRDILERQDEEGWGSKVIDRLSRDLKVEFPETKGFSTRNLKYMRVFAKEFPDSSIVQQLAAQIPWYHTCMLIDKVKDPTERRWYIQKTIKHGWSRNVLALQIETNLYHRQGGAITNFHETLPPTQSDLAQSLLKSEYNLEFLQLKEKAHERELEVALVNHIQKFLLELGVGFSFMGRQYRVEVGNSEFFIDLLFYHVRLRCYVVIELKTTEFRPEYTGKINFYVNVINDKCRHPDDKPTIGIVLCRSHNEAVVQYALQGFSQPIGVATYQLTDSLPDAVAQGLPSPKELQRELEAVAAQFERDHPPNAEKT
jgi:predicted nuclease of restriction endonuclease-like (RecB) superfamily